MSKEKIAISTTGYTLVSIIAVESINVATVIDKILIEECTRESLSISIDHRFLHVSMHTISDVFQNENFLVGVLCYFATENRVHKACVQKPYEIQQRYKLGRCT